eukprot:2299525-Karenia_brevis.AAC.1
MYLYYSNPDTAFQQMKTLQQQLPFPEYQINRAATPVLAAMRHPSSICYSSLKHHCTLLDTQMPPSNTTPITDANTPHFTIQLYHPTKKHPHPPMPPYIAITSTLYHLPTTTKYIIQINQDLPLQGGQRLDAREVANTIQSRMGTWMNPTAAEVEIRIDDGQQLKLHRP